jgi:hypothetical protein
MEFMTTISALHRILNGLLYTEKEIRVRQEDVKRNNPF